jgi:hypothetical protein
MNEKKICNAASIECRHVRQSMQTMVHKIIDDKRRTMRCTATTDDDHCSSTACKMLAEMMIDNNHHMQQQLSINQEEQQHRLYADQFAKVYNAQLNKEQRRYHCID